MVRNLSPKTDVILLGSLFLWELSITVMAMMLYRKGDRPFGVFVSATPGVVFLITIALSLSLGAVILLKYIASQRSQSRHCNLIVMMNLADRSGCSAHWRGHPEVELSQLQRR